ncbi:hypothetical protein Tco_1158741 [Tanacetum coccineum]
MSYDLVFMVNGESVGVVKPQRGLPQGELISLYLFIIVVDVLSRQIKKAMEFGSLSGIKMSRTYLVILHIFFADNSIFFLKASQAECESLVSILLAYSHVSGQNVNIQNDAHARHVHWKNWEKLSEPKAEGGLGFCDLEAFNIYIDAVVLSTSNDRWYFSLSSSGEFSVKDTRLAIDDFGAFPSSEPTRWGGFASCLPLVGDRFPALAFVLRMGRVVLFYSDAHARHVHWKNWEKLSEPKAEGVSVFVI